jgi:hypothetical protein
MGKIPFRIIQEYNAHLWIDHSKLNIPFQSQKNEIVAEDADGFFFNRAFDNILCQYRDSEGIIQQANGVVSSEQKPGLRNRK